MARAPFSIEWLSQSSRRRPLGPCSSSGDTPTPSGPAPSELCGESPQPGISFPGLWSLPASPPALAGSLPGHRTPETGRRKGVYDQLSPLSHLVPQKTFAAGVIPRLPTRVQQENRKSPCSYFCIPTFTPKEVEVAQTRAMRVKPAAQTVCHPRGRPQTRTAGGAPHQLPSSQRRKTPVSTQLSVPGAWGRRAPLYTVDPSAIRQGRSSVSPPDCASPPEEGIGLYDCGSPQKEGSSAYPQEGEDEEGRVNRRLRTAFSSEQIGSLEKTFKRQRYLSAFERRKLAARLQLSEVQLKTWFQNRRMKLKRQLQDQQPDPFAQPPFLGGLPYGQQVYPSFYQYAAAGALPAAHSPSRLVPSLYPLDSYAGYVQPHMQHPAAFGYF